MLMIIYLLKVEILKKYGRKLQKDIKILNFAFDLVPTEYITGIITEFGIIKPKDIKKL